MKATEGHFHTNKGRENFQKTWRKRHTKENSSGRGKNGPKWMHRNEGRNEQ